VVRLAVRVKPHTSPYRATQSTSPHVSTMYIREFTYHSKRSKPDKLAWRAVRAGRHGVYGMRSGRREGGLLDRLKKYHESSRHTLFPTARRRPTTSRNTTSYPGFHCFPTGFCRRGTAVLRGIPRVIQAHTGLHSFTARSLGLVHGGHHRIHRRARRGGFKRFRGTGARMI